MLISSYLHFPTSHHSREVLNLTQYLTPLEGIGQVLGYLVSILSGTGYKDVVTSVRNWKGHSKSYPSLHYFSIAVRLDLLGLLDKSCNLSSTLCNWCIALGGLLEKEAGILSFFFGNVLQRCQQKFKGYNAIAVRGSQRDVPHATLVLW